MGAGGCVLYNFLEKIFLTQIEYINENVIIPPLVNYKYFDNFLNLSCNILKTRELIISDVELNSRSDMKQELV